MNIERQPVTRLARLDRKREGEEKKVVMVVNLVKMQKLGEETLMDG